MMSLKRNTGIISYPIFCKVEIGPGKGDAYFVSVRQTSERINSHQKRFTTKIHNTYHPTCSPIIGDYWYDSIDRKKDNGFDPVFSWKNRVVGPFNPRKPGTRKVYFNVSRRENIDMDFVTRGRRRDAVWTGERLDHFAFGGVVKGRPLPPIASEGKRINLVYSCVTTRMPI
jgi:hypothetical protein